ncbi:MAG: 30S ribosome-binding factor RbfA [Chloroflexia bacterium]
MPSRRQAQVAEAVQQYVSQLLQRDMKDPRIGFVTVTSVEMSPDLKYARVFVSVMGTPEEQKATMDALASAKGFIRRELAARLDLRFAPEVQFKLDTSAEYSDRINRLLNELKAEEAGAGTIAAEGSRPPDSAVTESSPPEEKA